MAVIEREQMTTSEQVPERAIFVAADGRRARRLRRVAFAAVFLACLWVVGLGVGMLGFGSLPGVSLVKQPLAEIAVARPTHRAPRTTRLRLRLDDSSSLEARQVASARTSPAVRSQARARARRPVASRPVSRPPAQATAPPPVAQQPVNPAQRTRGWARSGQTAPRWPVEEGNSSASARDARAAPRSDASYDSAPGSSGPGEEGSSAASAYRRRRRLSA